MPEELDVSLYVRSYRRAVESGDAVRMRQLRELWTSLGGGEEDALHEMAFGSPDD